MKKEIKKNKNLSKNLLISLGILILAIGFLTGWVSKKFASDKNNSMSNLRLSGYKYTKPLLACDTETELTSKKTESLKKDIEDYIDSQKKSGNIDSVSVYLRDYSGGGSLTVNEQEKFYPASLNKIPVMITAYQMAQSDPNFINNRYLYNDPVDHNLNMEIAPAKFLKPGQSYSINEAIDHMIKYSDNNAFFFLTQHLNYELFRKSYDDLKIPFVKDTATREDSVTAKEFSYFLRVLFNATYIDKNLSEKALETLTQVEYKNGLAAALPDQVKIAHKFGITSTKVNGNTKSELHDCGIVYTDSPYLICVMTKGDDLKNEETILKNISKLAYDEFK